MKSVAQKYATMSLGCNDKRELEDIMYTKDFIFYFFIYKQGYPNLFEYLTIFSSVCSSSIPYTLGYYREESLRGGLKMLVKSFKLKISRIS